jgi:hypothetical protein
MILLNVIIQLIYMHTHVIGLQPARLDAALTAANAPHVSPDLRPIRVSAGCSEEWPKWINSDCYNTVAAK